MPDYVLAGESQGRLVKGCIVGFPKCGQISLQRWLEEKHNKKYTFDKYESIWRRDAEDHFKLLVENDVEILVITRDPVEACWSSYWYFTDERKEMTYEEWLAHKGCDKVLGERNPISCFNFDKWLVRLKKYNPTIYKLEDVKKVDKFPLLNPTSARIKMLVMTEEQITLTKKLLEEERRNHKTESWSVDY